MRRDKTLPKPGKKHSVLHKRPAEEKDAKKHHADRKSQKQPGKKIHQVSSAKDAGKEKEQNSSAKQTIACKEELLFFCLHLIFSVE